VIGAIADFFSVSVALSFAAVVTLTLVALGPRLHLRAAFDQLGNAEDPPKAESGVNLRLDAVPPSNPYHGAQ
jgi:hypothetical protein